MFIGSASVIAQVEQAKIIAVDALGRSDTVVIGMDNSSTAGIDASHGEFNIYGQPYDTVDIRVIHRDSLTPVCTPLFHMSMNLNADLKREFRPYEGFFLPLYPNFEMVVHADSFPVLIYGDFSGLIGMYGGGWSYLGQFDTNCVQEDIFSGPNQSMTYQYMFTMSDSSETVVRMMFDFEVGIKELSSSSISIHPNPTKDWITVSLEEGTATSVTIRNSFGQLLLSDKTPSTNQIELDLSSYPTGIYFLQLEVDGQVITKKVVKE
jgi:hypothetical protein